MFIKHEPLRDVLQDYYSDILKFHEAAIKVFARSKRKNVFHATWKTFNTQFDPIMKSLIHILRRQISDIQNTMSSQEFFEDFAKQNEVTIRSRESLETLTERALEEYRVSYLILDGLDECEREQARRTVEWLLALLGLDKYSGKTSLRIIFSGQRDGLLDDILSEFPNIRLESSEHNADIERYCLQYASKRQKRFRLNKDLETHIASLVTKGAQGNDSNDIHALDTYADFT
ncbi:Zinc finger protein [Colletotrichum sp. SAR 10_70]|nr:Zinc finger protein [Colletotrichum sp. SAR 10_71]KAI8204363.1 Zinc finger protein [Colletotrichum sp. SAR 10_70]